MFAEINKNLGHLIDLRSCCKRAIGVTLTWQAHHQVLLILSLLKSHPRGLIQLLLRYETFQTTEINPLQTNSAEALLLELSTRLF